MNSKCSKPTYLKIEPVLPFGFLIQQSFNIFSSKLNPSTLRASIAGRSAIGAEILTAIYNWKGLPEPPIICRSNHFFITNTLLLIKTKFTQKKFEEKKKKK